MIYIEARLVIAGNGDAGLLFVAATESRCGRMSPDVFHVTQPCLRTALAAIRRGRRAGRIVVLHGIRGGFSSARTRAEWVMMSTDFADTL